MALADDPVELDRLDTQVVDVIVIGSGYGAGVCAARLAENGASVCVLERGRELTAGQFPSTIGELRHDVQIDGSLFRRDHRLGLFNCYIGSDLDVIVGCGLGGTSLINAGVTIAPDPRVFAQQVWPTAIRAEAADGTLQMYFQRAWNVLDPAPFPAGPSIPKKLVAMERNGAARCALNIHFGPAGPNSVGVEQGPCNHCGDCVTGCNAGAKKTLCFTYLPIAKSFGAKIFVQCDVQHLERHGDLWEVHFQRIETGTERVEPTRKLRARAVVVAAGVMGTTGILMRSRDLALSLSTELGGRVSGNGDAFAFAYACDDDLDTVGTWPRLDPAHPTGATILGVIDRRAGALADGFIIQEAAFPSGTAATLRKLIQVVASYCGTETQHGFEHWFRDRLHEAQDLLGIHTEDGVLERTLMFLLMGHDGADGVIELDGQGRSKIVWPHLREHPLFAAQNAAALAIAAKLGGMFVEDPLFTRLLTKQKLTVHPLGGCPMGDAGAGVVDHAGRVLAEDGSLQPRLYVADASVIPTSLGVNPLWTITALAERIAAHAVVDLELAPTLADVKASLTIRPGTTIRP